MKKLNLQVLETIDALLSSLEEDRMTPQQAYNQQYGNERIAKYGDYKQRLQQWRQNLKDKGLSDTEIARLTQGIQKIASTGTFDGADLSALWPKDKLRSIPQEWLYGNPVDAGGYAVDGETKTSRTGWNQISRYDNGPDGDITRTIVRHDPNSTATSADDISGRVRRPLQPNLSNIMNYPENPDYDEFDTNRGGRVRGGVSRTRESAEEMANNIMRSSTRASFSEYNEFYNELDKAAKAGKKAGDTITVGGKNIKLKSNPKQLHQLSDSDMDAIDALAQRLNEKGCSSKYKK